MSIADTLGVGGLAVVLWGRTIPDAVVAAALAAVLAGLLAFLNAWRDRVARREAQEREIAARRWEREQEWRNERDRDGIEAGALARRAASAVQPDRVVPLMTSGGEQGWRETLATRYREAVELIDAATEALDA